MDTLEKKIRMLNREILALKTSHPLKSFFRTFWAEFTITIPVSDYSQIQYYEITYADGSQPILADVGASIDEEGIGQAWPGMFNLESPIGNKQILVVWSYYQTEEQTIYATIQSTRQILGVRKINPPN